MYALVFALALQSDSLARFEFVESHMGTLFRIVVYAPTADAARAGSDAAFSRIAQLNGVFSDYDSTSEASRLARNRPNIPVPVSRDMLELVSRAESLVAVTGGAFDVTVGPAVQLWRRSRRTRSLPSERERRLALASVGYRNLAIDVERTTVTMRVPGMQLDFGGIAKGAAADAALAELRRGGLPRAMVAAGGDLALGDAPPGSTGWRVAGTPTGRSFSNCGISTSGDATQFVVIAGVRYAHILDPRTGLGVTDGREVTVVAPSATESDALATAAYVLGEATFRAAVRESRGVEAWFVATGGDGRSSARPVRKQTERIKQPPPLS